MASRRILSGFLFLVVTMAIATGGYVASGWSLLDAVYMGVITVFGVGYGEVREMSAFG